MSIMHTRDGFFQMRRKLNRGQQYSDAFPGARWVAGSSGPTPVAWSVDAAHRLRSFSRPGCAHQGRAGRRASSARPPRSPAAGRTAPWPGVDLGQLHERRVEDARWPHRLRRWASSTCAHRTLGGQTRASTLIAAGALGGEAASRNEVPAPRADTMAKIKSS